MTEAQPARPKARELNQVIRYTMWSVFRWADRRPASADEISEVGDLLQGQTRDAGIEVRGWYDVAGLRADADVLVWWHAPTAEALQQTYRGLLATAIGSRLIPVWSNMALHRPAEFNKSHIPAFLAGEPAKDWVCVYPFVRSYEWYLLPDEERRALLAEHGRLARGFPDVRANTVPSFALGDYEWILAFEGDELHRIVDLMRHLRGSEARRHVREEVPFYTGALVPVADLLARLP
jgi:hydrogen peroxide-dependent heme synthase